MVISKTVKLVLLTEYGVHAVEMGLPRILLGETISKAVIGDAYYLRI